MEAIRNYVTAILLILVITLGFMTYIYHDDVVRLERETVDLTSKLRTSEANVTLAQKSCEATQAITANVSADIETKQTVMTKTLETLATVTTTLPENDTDAKKYADDARLSPSLMRLLDTTYCTANKTDASCASKSSSGMSR